MIGKRKFRKIVLSSAAKKGKKDRDKFRTTTRVIFSSKESSKGSLDAVLKMKSDHKVADDLLDR